uniref:I-set domain-containing protein n=1 Tax=Gongylonema pulchrum TaxID=637853 RepID=A0A183DJZ8_9BILA
LPVSPDFTAFFDGEIARLTISRMSEQKSGLFKCTAKNDYGEVDCSAMVTFEHSGSSFFPKFLP